MEIFDKFNVDVASICCQLQPLPGSEKTRVWWAVGFPDGEAMVYRLALKFASRELAAKFKDVFEQAAMLRLGRGSLT